MSDIATVLGDLGAALPSIEHRGKQYQARRLVQSRKAKFVQWLKNRALGDVALLRSTLGEEEYQTKKAALYADFDAGKYSFFGPIAQRALSRGADIRNPDSLPDPDAMMAFISIIFDCSEDDALFLVSEKPSEVGVLIGQVLLESLPKIEQPAQKATAEAGEAVPNPKAAAV